MNAPGGSTSKMYRVTTDYTPEGLRKPVYREDIVKILFKDSNGILVLWQN